LRLPTAGWCGSLMACVLAGYRGVEWLEKGLFCSKKRCPPAGPQASEGEEGGVGRVAIGVGPHELAATVEVLDERLNVLGGGRFGTDRDGYRRMVAVARRWPDRPTRSLQRPVRTGPHPGQAQDRRVVGVRSRTRRIGCCDVGSARNVNGGGGSRHGRRGWLCRGRGRG
jgi:hypothetical protein